MTTLPTIAQIEAARERIAGIAVRTPLVRLPVDDAPAAIHLKLECLQPIGSFKLRGAANAIELLPAADLARGVLTASAGNMAQGVAFSARRHGVPCTVVSPDTAPQTKLDAIRRLGATVIQEPFDRWWQTFVDRAYPGVDATFVHAFDDVEVMAGNGTIGLELLEDLPAVDTIVVPWGGGGLACGIAAAVKARRPDVRVLAAEAATSTPFASARAAGAPVAVEYTSTFVDGIGSRRVFDSMFARARDVIDGAVVADVPAVAAAVRLLAERTRVVAEGAGAVALATALAGDAGTGTVACIVSGGNIDTGTLRAILAGEL